RRRHTRCYRDWSSDVCSSDLACTITLFAVTVVAAESVIVHAPVPEQPPPLQPVKAEPLAGLAVRVTTVPLAKLAVHVAPQVIPRSEERRVGQAAWMQEDGACR